MPGQLNEFYDFAVFNGTLYAAANWGTYFYTWDGSTWQTRTGYTIHGNLRALASCNEKLILGGYFEQLDSDTCNNIASWDGSTFSPISTGLTGGDYPRVLVVKCIDGRLIVGGRFTTAGGVPANNIAEWSYK
jgi:hypothetical protein